MDRQQELLIARTYAAGEQYDRALHTLAPVLASDPDDSEVLALTSLVLTWSGSMPDEAVRLAGDAVTRDPESIESWWAQAEALSAANLHERAFVAAERVVELEPDSWRSHSLMARVAGRNYRRSAECLVAAAEAVRLGPDQPHTHVMLGNVWLARNKYHLAMRCYREALRLDPQDPFARASLVHARFDNDNSDDVVLDFVDLSAARPGDTYTARGLRFAVGDVFNRLQGLLVVGILLLFTTVLIAAVPLGVDSLAARALYELVVIAILLVGAVLARRAVLALGGRLPTMIDFVRNQDRFLVVWAWSAGIAAAALLVAPLLPVPAMFWGAAVAVVAAIVGGVIVSFRDAAIRGSSR